MRTAAALCYNAVLSHMMLVGHVHIAAAFCISYGRTYAHTRACLTDAAWGERPRLISLSHFLSSLRRSIFQRHFSGKYYQFSTDSSRPRALVCLVPDGFLALCLKICISLRTSTAYSRPLLGVLFQVVHLYHSPETFSYLLCSALVAGYYFSAQPQYTVTRQQQQISNRPPIRLHIAGHLHPPISVTIKTHFQTFVCT